MTGSARGSGPNRGLERHVVVRRHHGRRLYTVMAGRCEWCALGPAAVTAAGDSKHEGKERPREESTRARSAHVRTSFTAAAAMAVSRNGMPRRPSSLRMQASTVDNHVRPVSATWTATSD